MNAIAWGATVLGWLMVTTSACYMAYQAGRRKECGLWETWYEHQQAIDRADRKKKQDMRFVNLTTVQFRR